MSKGFLVFLLVSIIAGRRGGGGGGGSRGSSGTFKSSGTYSRKQTDFSSTKIYGMKRNPITGIMETRKKQPARRRYQADAVDCNLREAYTERDFQK